MIPSEITTAARKALIAAHPLYYSWPFEQQEKFRATMDEATRNRVRTVLLREIKGIACTTENASEVWDGIPIAELDDLNWAQLLTQGIGENLIFLNESMAENTSLLDFQTLHDYDFDDYLFQEKVNKEEFGNYQERDYYALRFTRWARLIIDGRFHYANLYSLAGYVTDFLEDQSRDIIQSLIPHDYREGSNHGKKEKGGFLWDMRLDADGLERQLNELQRCWHDHLQKRWIALSQALLQEPPAVYVVDTSEQGERHRDFIFNNEAALKQTCWQHFIADCQRIEAETNEAIHLRNQELASATHWLQKAHQDIMKNFDPSVSPLRHKKRIIVAPGVFDALDGHDEEDGDLP